jgi:hypothetical protein
MSRVFAANELDWRAVSKGKLGLHLGRDRVPLLHVVADETYPGMWRVLTSDGALSDTVNLSRAKDAGLAIALRELNRKERQERPQEPRLCEFPTRPLREGGTRLDRMGEAPDRGALRLMLPDAI